MQVLAVIFGLFLVAMVLIDAFETIVLPRTVRRAIRLTSTYFWLMSFAYVFLGKMRHSSRRQTVLNGFAPMMLIGLIVVWAAAMIIGFAFLYWGSGMPFKVAHEFGKIEGPLYFSGVTFFTLGYGDIVPASSLGRGLAVCEAGVGLGFLALIIAYIPVIYSAFSRREVQMLLLDSKAGSEPTATELLRRHAVANAMPALTALLKEWERFSAELLESYLSYPILAYYRSQHDDQNWLHSLTAIMDACALIESGFDGDPEWMAGLKFQARATFTMARHVVVDLAYILDAEPIRRKQPRLSDAQFHSMCFTLREAGLKLTHDEVAAAKLTENRALYEPFICGLSKELAMDLPVWIPAEHVKDNWETTAWDGAKHF